MLHNNLDPDVAERPDDLVVYGGTGRAARSWEAFDAITRTLRTLAGDETLLVQSGKPVGVFRTHEWAPRVLLANSNLVPEWATWDEFRRLEALGLTMYGQMTAGSWIYIGSQGIVQGTYECFAEIARRHHGGSLAGTITLTAGLGGMGGAQPLAVTMNGGVALCVEVDPQRIERRVQTRYLDEVATSLEDAVARARRRPRRAPRGQHRPVRERRRRAAAAAADAASRPTSSPTRRAPTIRSSATSRTGCRSPRPTRCGHPTRPSTSAARAPSIAAHCAAMVGFLDAGAEVFDYGNSLRAEARLGGFERAFAYPGFVPAYVRPLFCEGKGPFRWVALSGDPADIAATDRAVLEEFPRTRRSRAGSRTRASGSPSRGCRRGSAGWATASAPAWACGSTRWSPPASCARRS